MYNAVKNSPQWDRTLLIITHDEHGGTYDHVSPPTGVMPPNGNPLDPQQNGFTFNRLGVRVPMIMVSAHIAPNTIVNDQKQHTSFLKTMSKKWDLGTFTQRDANAPEFSEVFTSEEVRADWVLCFFIKQTTYIHLQ